jgi:methyltransferase FkbM-like protein
VIVVDLGCQTYGSEESVEKLISLYSPALLYGFDPHPETADTVRRIGDTTVVTARKAAWVIDGTRQIHVDGSSTRIAGDGDVAAQTFDLSAWLFTLPRVPTVLKLDVEGAEYELLPHIAHRMADRLLERILVEWHRDPLDLDLDCPVQPWP